MRKLEYLTIAIVVVGLTVTAIVVERANNEAHLVSARAAVQDQLGELRGRLETNLQANIQLVRGLPGLVTLLPNINQEQFERAAQPLFEGRSQLRNIALAPGLVIQMMYPMAGNEEAIGLDYRLVPAQFEAADRAQETRHLVLAGPVNLVQGGVGFISRIPVFLPQPGGGERYWGLISAVVDAHRLYQESGLNDPDLPVEIAIRGRDATGPDGDVFFGREEIFQDEPVLSMCPLPHGSWMMAAVPKGGWPTRSAHVWRDRAIFFLVGSCLVVPLLFLARTRQALCDAVVTLRRFTGTLDSTFDSVFIFDDGSLRFTYVNQGAVRQLGYSRDELLTMHLYDVTPQFTMQSFLEHIAPLRDPSTPSLKFETNLKHKDGHCVPVELVLQLVQTPDQRRCFVAVVRDVTERKKLEAQLLYAQKLESLGVLAGGMAHDFNNILAAIMGHATLASENPSLDAGTKDALDHVSGSAKRAAELCDHLLAYAGKGRIIVEPVDLSALVRETEDLLHVSLSKKTQVRLDLADDLPAIEADAAQVRQVIMNLFSNAGEAIGDAEGLVAVQTGCRRFEKPELAESLAGAECPPGEYVYAKVSDTGCGMDAATLSKMFDPFFTTKGAGRGLGMAAVVGIIRSHGGAIHCRSKPGTGASFTVLFPPSPRSAATPPANEPLPAERTYSGTALVVDDEPGVRLFVERALRGVGFSVLTAEDGFHGMKLFETHAHQIDLAVVDVSMPRMSGVEMMWAMRDVNPNVRVILTSGYTEEGVAPPASDNAPNEFLKKPFRLRDLREAVSRVVHPSSQELNSVDCGGLDRLESERAEF